ncbi:hypothetical protein TCA2_2722 [Paenibacillus sp. TCA20]|uniref:hypothetical protein n=1 Tax=Paenibacillus sp. TCA20 TaxID=1499968 RepID=UPI0004D6A753|nr:hypothetical protein [Paenibacillus sp. TCA20]GAK40232.1 hypothetical protein TCA2_2722 [Paenibacillus sp. TCA20]
MKFYKSHHFILSIMIIFPLVLIGCSEKNSSEELTLHVGNKYNLSSNYADNIENNFNFFSLIINIDNVNEAFYYSEGFITTNDDDYNVMLEEALRNLYNDQEAYLDKIFLINKEIRESILYLNDYLERAAETQSLEVKWDLLREKLKDLNTLLISNDSSHFSLYNLISYPEDWINKEDIYQVKLNEINSIVYAIKELSIAE